MLSKSQIQSAFDNANSIQEKLLAQIAFNTYIDPVNETPVEEVKKVDKTRSTSKGRTTTKRSK